MTTDRDNEHTGAVLLPEITPGHDDIYAMRALTGDNVTGVNPARAYLLSLNSPRSRQTMASFLNIVARILGASDLSDCSWGSIRRHHVMALVDMLRDSGLAVATVNTYLSALRGVAAEAWMLKLMSVEDYQHIRAVRSVRGNVLPRGRALRKEEISALFAACDADHTSKGLRDAALIGVILGCGLRRTEAVSLSWDDISFQEKALKVHGKGNKMRVSYVPAGAWERLMVWIEQIRGEHAGPLFVRIRRHDTLTEDRLTDQAVYHILQVRQQMAGIVRCAPHDLRRTFATAMLDSGEDLITVKDALGHASVSTTQKYDRRGDARLKLARDKIFIVN